MYYLVMSTIKGLSMSDVNSNGFAGVLLEFTCIQFWRWSFLRHKILFKLMKWKKTLAIWGVAENRFADTSFSENKFPIVQ